MKRRDVLLGLGMVGAGSLAAPRAMRAWAFADLSLIVKGFAETSLGSDSYFELHGNAKGPGVLLAGPVFSRTSVPANVSLQTQIKQGYIRSLGRRYRLLITDYPHIESKGQEGDKPRLAVEDVCKDYLSLADAAGLDHFAAAGYSWGGNAVLQLATRSRRVAALVVGGWPAIDGPYDLLLQSVLAQQMEHPDRPEIGRYINYYKSLQNWPERAEVEKLTCPRLNYVDAADGDDTDFIGRFRKNRDILQKLGWETAEVKSGNGHAGGLMPDFACPVIGAFLDKHFLPN